MLQEMVLYHSRETEVKVDKTQDVFVTTKIPLVVLQGHTHSLLTHLTLSFTPGNDQSGLHFYNFFSFQKYYTNVII